jgi:hypothetical protein
MLVGGWGRALCALAAAVAIHAGVLFVAPRGAPPRLGADSSIAFFEVVELGEAPTESPPPERRVIEVSGEKEREGEAGDALDAAGASGRVASGAARARVGRHGAGDDASDRDGTLGVLEALASFEMPAPSDAFRDARRERPRDVLDVPLHDDFFCGTATLGRGSGEVARAASSPPAFVPIVPFTHARRPWRAPSSVSMSNVTTIDICGRPETDWCRRWPTLADAIRRAMARHRGAFRYCYERALADRPELEGRVVLEVTLGVDGEAERVAVSSSTLGAADVEACVVRVVERAELPRVEQPVTFRYPLRFGRGP